MKIKYLEKGEERVIDVNFWSFFWLWFLSYLVYMGIAIVVYVIFSFVTL
jgi:hypothetical protein